MWDFPRDLCVVTLCTLRNSSLNRIVKPHWTFTFAKNLSILNTSISAELPTSWNYMCQINLYINFTDEVNNHLIMYPNRQFKSGSVLTCSFLIYKQMTTKCINIRVHSEIVWNFVKFYLEEFSKKLLLFLKDEKDATNEIFYTIFIGKAYVSILLWA